MADKLTVERRSWNMSKIRSEDTTIETKVRAMAIPSRISLQEKR